MGHVRVPAFTTASALDLISPQSVAHICRRKLRLSTLNSQQSTLIPTPKSAFHIPPTCHVNLRASICSAIFFPAQSVHESEGKTQRGSFGSDICCQCSGPQPHCQRSQGRAGT